MPTSTNVTNLKINELKEAQYDTAVQQGIIGANELSILTDADVGGLPDQTGQSGKFLTTDGTDASWSDKPLVNTATGTGSLSIQGAASSQGNSINIGYLSSAVAGKSVSIGQGSRVGSTGGVAVGKDASCNGGGVSIGFATYASGTNSIQIGGSGLNAGYINSDADTVKFGNRNGNYEIMSADGTIPTDRLTKVNSTITLTSAGWSSNTQTVNVTGMTATGVVMVSPDPTYQSAYTSAGILCTAQAAGTLTFSCDTVPSGDIDVNIVCL